MLSICFAKVSLKRRILSDCNDRASMEEMLPGDSAACRTHIAPNDAKREEGMKLEVEGTGEAGAEELGEEAEQDVVVVVVVALVVLIVVALVVVVVALVVVVAAVVEDTVDVKVGMEEDVTETIGVGEVLDIPKAAVETTAAVAPAAGGDEAMLSGTDWERGGSSASCAGVSGGGESAM